MIVTYVSHGMFSMHSENCLKAGRRGTGSKVASATKLADLPRTSSISLVNEDQQLASTGSNEMGTKNVLHDALDVPILREPSPIPTQEDDPLLQRRGDGRESSPPLSEHFNPEPLIVHVHSSDWKPGYMESSVLFYKIRNVGTQHCVQVRLLKKPEYVILLQMGPTRFLKIHIRKLLKYC